MQKLTLFFGLMWFTVQAQVPQLQSLPGAANVVLLDFDGATVNNPNWYASQIDAASANWTSVQITECFWRTAEKFTPFNINITTVQSVYDAAQASRRMRCILTPTSQWYGSAGGVAFVGSFGYSAYDPCWVFTNMVSNNVKYAADAAAHEIGHTLWLNHHGQFDAACNRTSSYHGGKGTGETSWGPIMGAAYNANVAQWYNGTTTTLTCFGNVVDDLNKITTFGTFVTYKIDDRSNDIVGALPIGRLNTAVSDSGTIERTADKDCFKITAVGTFTLNLTIKPFTPSPMLDVKAELLDAAGNVLRIDSNLNSLQAVISISNQSAGTYFIRVSGSGHPNYIDYGSTQPTNYGSLGRYYITGTITETQPPATCDKPIVNASTDCKHTTINTLPVSGATAYSYSYSLDELNWLGGTTTSATSQQYQIGANNYVFSVVATCGTVQSQPTFIGYSVPVYTIPPPQFSTASVANGRLTITIENNNAYRWTIRYRLQGTTTWLSYNTTKLTTNVNKLERGKTYEVQVRSKCFTGTGQYSQTQTQVIK